MHYKNLAFAYLFLRFNEAIFMYTNRRLHILLQRLMPIDFAQDLFLIRTPEVVLNKFYHYRPYTPADEVNYLPVYSKMTHSNSKYPTTKYVVLFINIKGSYSPR